MSMPAPEASIELLTATEERGPTKLSFRAFEMKTKIWGKNERIFLGFQKIWRKTEKNEHFEC